MKDKFNLILLIMAIGIMFMFFQTAMLYSSRRDIDVIIRNKTTIIDSKDPKDVKSKYLIFTDVEVFENTDCWQYFKFQSSDFYEALEIGKKYKLSVVGLRLPFFSKYRNIIDYKEIK